MPYHVSPSQPQITLSNKLEQQLGHRSRACYQELFIWDAGDSAKTLQLLATWHSISSTAVNNHCSSEEEDPSQDMMWA